MDQYDSNVQTIMNFLKDEGYEAPELSVHRVCYREFKKYLLSSGCGYSKEKGDEWQKENVTSWSKWRVRRNRICLMQLKETYELGYPRKDHRHIYPIWYGQLNETLSQELNSYMEDFPSGNEKYWHDVKRMCSDFLLFLQYRGKTSITDIDYEDTECYYYHETERTKTTKALYVNHARAMLIYYSNKGVLKRSLGFHMDSLCINQIVSLDGFSPEDIEKINACREEGLDFPAVEMWDAISEFIKVMAEHNYSETNKICAKHTLTLLFIFLEKYNMGYTPEIACIWFEYEKRILGVSWKASRKVIYQFEEFTKEGNIFPGKYNCYKLMKIDLLPLWCQDIINEFLLLKKREFMKKSTIDMYRAASVRLCEYLVAQGLASFDELTAKHLNNFNLQDNHSTLDGKNAYNVRIRNFLIYLEEKGYIKNLFIHKALPCSFAPRERVVQVLNQNEISEIHEFHNVVENAYDLRRDAMVMLGLKMGLRGSDIVKLHFSDINWNDMTIRIIQQKTLVEELLPMPIIVGNAIFKYITKGRPSSKSPYIFIHHNVPYSKLTPSVCRTALKAAVPLRETPDNGFHITRKTFATSLLNAGNEVGTIIDSLGHRTNSTVEKYLSLDEERMLMCPLSFDEAGISGMGGASGC
ncbi:tyrosine-type recombinase/integrase [Enterococcus larvae]|uniref:tyrosine-type recombinase/integrase n=1 Tax=Enterococcus larvae TaxID=2794352 RepID=UPI003F32F775